MPAVLLAASCGSSNDTAASTTTAPQADSTATVEANDSDATPSTRELTSSAMVECGEMPVDYTCDGYAATPPLEWSDAPDGTAGYAVVMHQVAGPGDTHWYWEPWNIPGDVTSMTSNGEPPGDVGINSVNKRNEYAPPCSKGPGTKPYTFTVYALSAQPALPTSSTPLPSHGQSSSTLSMDSFSTQQN